MLFLVEQAFVGRYEIPVPLKTPAWEDITRRHYQVLLPVGSSRAKLFRFYTVIIIAEGRSGNIQIKVCCVDIKNNSHKNIKQKRLLIL